MTRYWVISPFGYDIEIRRQVFESIWKFDLENKVISIGWHELDDVTAIKNIEDLRGRVEREYSQYSAATVTRFVNMLWNFTQVIEVGDAIIARRGRKCIAKLGKAES